MVDNRENLLKIQSNLNRNIKKTQQNDYLHKLCFIKWDDYITPEGKFDIILFGKQSYDAEAKKAVKEFVKEFDGEYPAKDSIGLLDDVDGNILNDLSIIVEKAREIYG